MLKWLLSLSLGGGVFYVLVHGIIHFVFFLKLTGIILGLQIFLCYPFTWFLERHLDPTTAQYDAAGKRQRPANYWATLDLEWWEKEGYPAHMEKIRNFPWDSLEDQMQFSGLNLNEATMA